MMMMTIMTTMTETLIHPLNTIVTEEAEIQNFSDKE